MSSTARRTVVVKTTGDVVDVVRAASAEGTTLTAARQTAGTAVRLDLSEMNGVVEYPARDMTITVEAGMTLQALTDVLRQEGQQLPVDFCDPDMSVGAFVASNLAGSRQYGYGTLRDYLIGMEAVDGHGRVFHAGGRVVKNVAGYDLCRLMVGSRGALAILCRLTFKLKPVAVHFAVQRWQFDNDSAVTASLESMNGSEARPMVLDLHAANDSTWSLFVGVDGPANVCNWQIERLNQEMKTPTSSEIHAADHETAMMYCQKVAGQHRAPNAVAVVRALPSRVTDVCRVIHTFGLGVVCHAGNGIINICSGDSAALPDEAVERIQTLVKEHGGYVRLPHGEAVGSRPAGSFSAGLVDAFDPQHVFV